MQKIHGEGKISKSMEYEGVFKLLSGIVTPSCASQRKYVSEVTEEEIIILNQQQETWFKAVIGRLRKIRQDHRSAD